MQKLDIIHIENIPIGTVITQLEKLYDLNLVFFQPHAEFYLISTFSHSAN